MREKVARLETLKKLKALMCQCSSSGLTPSRNRPALRPRRQIASSFWMAAALSSRISSDCLQIGAVMDVLDHHHADEIRVAAVVVEGEFGQPLQRLDRRQVIEFQFLFPGADLAVGLLENAAVEALLVAEIIIDHALRGVRLRGDLVDPRARKPVGGELGHGDGKDVLPDARGVLLPAVATVRRSCRPWTARPLSPCIAVAPGL